MMTIFKYRLLVISTFVALISSLSTNLYWQKDLVNFVADFASTLLNVSETRNFLFIAFVTVMLPIASYSFIGLLLFKKYARYVFLAMFVFMIPIYLLQGITVQSGLSRIFWDLGLVMSGIVLTLSYTRPIKSNFN